MFGVQPPRWASPENDWLDSPALPGAPHLLPACQPMHPPPCPLPPLLPPAEAGLGRFVPPAFMGFAGQLRGLRLQGGTRQGAHEADITLLARRSLRRPGCRQWRRGADLQASVANFVESEQLVVIDGGAVQASFVQAGGGGGRAVRWGGWSAHASLGGDSGCRRGMALGKLHRSPVVGCTRWRRTSLGAAAQQGACCRRPTPPPPPAPPSGARLHPAAVEPDPQPQVQDPHPHRPPRPLRPRLCGARAAADRGIRGEARRGERGRPGLGREQEEGESARCSATCPSCRRRTPWPLWRGRQLAGRGAAK